MKRFLDQPIIPIKSSVYLTLIIIIAPLLNFLSGINIDMYAPSMPSIAQYFSVSIMIIKNTISMTILGMTLGCIIFGTLIDAIGRKRVLLIGTFFYVLASIAATYSHTAFDLMAFRFIQGIMISTITIGCRALIIDNIQGPRYAIAILYTSIAYGSGPIVGPFVGGLIQHNFGWEANFIALAIIAGILFLLLLFFIKESLPQKHSLALRNIFLQYLKVFQHKQFVAGIIICALAQIELMIYPTLGPFIVENVLHRSVLVYGNTAMIVGASYLSGALINRFLLHYTSPKKICYWGCIGLALALVISHIFSAIWTLNLFTFMLPIILLGISVGFIFPNIMAINLQQFPKNAGIAMAAQTVLLTFIVALGLVIINYFDIRGLSNLAIIYTVLVLLQIILFFVVYKKIFSLN